MGCSPFPEPPSVICGQADRVIVPKAKRPVVAPDKVVQKPQTLRIGSGLAIPSPVDSRRQLIAITTLEPLVHEPLLHPAVPDVHLCQRLTIQRLRGDRHWQGQRSPTPTRALPSIWVPAGISKSIRVPPALPAAQSFVSRNIITHHKLSFSRRSGSFDSSGRFACPRLKKRANVAAPSRAKRQVRWAQSSSCRLD